MDRISQRPRDTGNDVERPQGQPHASDPALPGCQHPDSLLVSGLAAALAAKGPAYQPRTHHLDERGLPLYTNRLIRETSPYLLQHAHNPVSWYPWGDEAFERARAEGKPVLLSVGYSTCHWCHVMERESFEDLEIARTLNEHFVAIKVDREERPDVDSQYMLAVQLMTGRGGWPMTVALTPDRRPFFAGTYFPARDGDRGALLGFESILRQLATRYRAEPELVTTVAARATAALVAAARPQRPAGVPGEGAIQRAVAQLAAGFDPRHGGFGGAPKFPTPANLELLARACRSDRSPQARAMLERTLEAMAAGGIYDHVGGGFHRYATDARWLVPHFEKMLYDNAQLVVAYLEGYQLTGRADFAQVAADTLDYLRREMLAPEGGFHSATDADSEVPEQGHRQEGWFFTWTPEELAAVLGSEDAAKVAAYYGASAGGNFEGRSVLHVSAPLPDVASNLGRSVEALQRTLAHAVPRLYVARSTRPRPLRDDKLIAAWNGLAISAFARGAMVLGRSEDAASAVRAAQAVLRDLRVDGLLRRTCSDGQARHGGTLEDYAFVAQGLLDLHEATHDPHWLDEARALHTTLRQRYWDEAEGGFFRTPAGQPDLLVREKPSYDGAEPSGNSVAVLNLLRLAQLTGEAAYRHMAERSLQAFGGALERGVGSPKMLCALDWYLGEPLEILIVGPNPGGSAPLEAVVHGSFVPHRTLVVAAEGEDLERQARSVPALADKRSLGGQATAYVCRGQRCEAPTADPETLRRLI